MIGEHENCSCPSHLIFCKTNVWQQLKLEQFRYERFLLRNQLLSAWLLLWLCDCFWAIFPVVFSCYLFGNEICFLWRLKTSHVPVIKLLEILWIGVMGSLVLLYCPAAALIDLWQQLVLLLLLWDFMPGIKLPKAEVAAAAAALVHSQACYSRNCIFGPKANRRSKSCNVYFHFMPRIPHTCKYS